MSLLIDALRKAEEQKRRSEPEAVQGATPDGSTAPSNARAARNLFEVKASRKSLSFPLLVGGLTTLASLGIGIYFWLQLKPSGPRLVAPAPEPATRPAAAPPSARPAPARAADEPPRRDTPAPASDTAQDHTPHGATPAEPARATAAAGASAIATPRPAPAGQAGRAPSAPAQAAQGGPVIRHSSAPAVMPELASAWSSYRAGDLERAQVLYQRVVSSDPRNVDALNGLASIAARRGRRADAIEGFRRSLAARPDDAVALAGLAALDADVQGEDPGAATSRLRAALAERPDQAALHFALGNALAAEQRWAEAQTRYFSAYGLDPTNPDYLFNLGVSLDHLGQRPLARRFYDQALRAADARAHAFDPVPVKARLEALGGPPPQETGRE